MTRRPAASSGPGQQVAPNFFAGIAKFLLLAIPLFILAGFILERCGISQRIICFANIMVGRRGDLP